MDDTEQQFHDDVEITDLPEETDTSHRRERARQVPPLLARWLVRRPLSPRHRFWRSAAISGSLALIAFIILASSATTRNALITGILGRQPTPTPTLPPSKGLFYIQGSPSWGRATLDGHTLARLPVVGKDQPLLLTRGLHAVQWRAVPFQLQSCVISIPPMAGLNNCQEPDAVQLKSGGFASIISFSESLDSLTSNQSEALTRATQSAVDALQSTEIVQPGEQYMDIHFNQLWVTASQPIKATLHYSLDSASTSNAPCVSSLGQTPISSCQDCHQICTAPDQEFPATPTNSPWSIVVLVSVSWKFTTLDGKVVAHNQPASAYHQDEYLLELKVTWDGTTWHANAIANNSAVPALGNIGCAPALEDVGNNGYNVITEGETVEGVYWQFAGGPNLASGCVATGSPQQNNANQPRLPGALLLHRFGVIVAANAAAHKYWPFLPLADTYEQRLALQLAAELPPSS